MTSLFHSVFVLFAVAPALIGGGDTVKKSVAALNDQALDLLEKQHYDEAISLLERAVEEEPASAALKKNLATALNNRGTARVSADRAGDAITDFESAIALVPGELPFRLNLAHARMRLRDFARAEATLRECRESHGDDPQVHHLLGVLYYVTDQLAPAIASLERRLELADDAADRALLDKAKREFAVSGDYVARFSNDFTLKFLAKDENYAVADELLAILQEARTRVGNELGHFPSGSTTVLVYGREGFEKATGAHGWIGGLYDGKIRLPVDDLARQRASIERTARHEYAHRVIADLAPRCPIWLNEGIAMYCEGDAEKAHDAIRELVRAGATPPAFAAMPATFATESDVERVKLGYSASRSIVAFLRERYGPGAIRAVLDSLHAGDDVDAALARACGRSLAEIERSWREDVLR